MRIMGLDFGSKTVGVAVSDALLMTAQGVETIWRKSPRSFVRHLRGLKRWQGNTRWTELCLDSPRI